MWYLPGGSSSLARNSAAYTSFSVGVQSVAQTLPSSPSKRTFFSSTPNRNLMVICAGARSSTALSEGSDWSKEHCAAAPDAPNCSARMIVAPEMIMDFMRVPHG